MRLPFTWRFFACRLNSPSFINKRAKGVNLAKNGVAGIYFVWDFLEQKTSGWLLPKDVSFEHLLLTKTIKMSLIFIKKFFFFLSTCYNYMPLNFANALLFLESASQNWQKWCDLPNFHCTKNEVWARYADCLADLVKFTVLHGKLHFLCSVSFPEE